VYVGPDGVAGVNPATRVNDDNIAQFDDPNYRYGPANGRYTPNASLDYEKLIQHVRAHPEQYTENVFNTVRDSLQFNGRVTEDVYAGYVMGEARLGRLDITTGARVEETRLTGRGVRQEITPAERARRAAFVGPITPDENRRRAFAEWSNVREDEGSYLNILPSLHFKYALSPNLQARASYSTGIGRPNFSNLLRTTTVNHDTMRVVAANSDLKPETTDNIDVMLEYYFEPAGYFSAGVFLKQIKDFIYGDTGAVIGPGADNGFDGDYVGYSLVQNVNGGSGRVRGFEFAYSQRFTRLPGFWKGFGLNANYTRIESRGNYGASSGTQTNAEIAGFMPETFNASLSYQYRAWDVQVKYTHRAQNLRDFNANPLLRVYYYSKKNVDLNLKYKLHPRLTLFVDVINVFDDPIANAFVYVPQRVRFNQIFTAAIKAGVSGRF
jgi:TonB-dependent receptor